MKFMICLLIVLIFTNESYSSDLVKCFKDAGYMYGINPDLLWAIAKNESGFRQNAINVNKNGSYDVGIMQINSFWKGVIGEKLWEKVKSDYCFNIKVGAWVLAGCILRYGYTWDAIGCYNAVSKHKRSSYAVKINNILQKEYKRLGIKK